MRLAVRSLRTTTYQCVPPTFIKLKYVF